jgi:hypothetical protein
MTRKKSCFAILLAAAVAVSGCATDCDAVGEDVAKVASDAARGCSADTDCRVVTTLPLRLYEFCATACGVVAGTNLSDAQLEAALVAASDGADDCRCTTPTRCSTGRMLACISGTCTVRAP